MLGSPVRRGRLRRGQRFALSWAAGTLAVLLLSPKVSFAQDPGSSEPEVGPAIALPEVSGRAEDAVRGFVPGPRM